MRRLLIVVTVALLFGPAPLLAAQAAPAPQSDPAQLEAVARVLRTTFERNGTSQAERHAQELRALGFDVLPVARELLHNNRISTEAARAMLLLDEPRALAMILESIPRASLSTQLVGFVWFLEHEGSLDGRLNPDAHAAALRVLARIESTAMAELALYTIGMVGTADDFALLQEFASSRAPGTQGLRTASEAALGRLGSKPHLDLIRQQLTEALPERPTYMQGLRVAQVLRQAAFSANPALVPAVCGHLSDPAVGDIDIRIDLAAISANTLSLLLEPVTPERPRGAPRRSLTDWRTYCADGL